MNDVLSLCAALPRRTLAAGESLIQEGARADRLFVLASGAFEVVRGGVRVTEIREPGAFLGEMSALLGTASTANVAAIRDSEVYVLEQASETIRRNPALTYAVAQLLARRLLAVTAYLVDIKQQYGESDTHLALMDTVLAGLMAAQPGAGTTGSERADVPDY